MKDGEEKKKRMEMIERRKWKEKGKGIERKEMPLPPPNVDVT